MTTTVTVRAAAHQVKITESQNPQMPTILTTTNQEATVYVHSGNTVTIEETGESATPQVDQLNVGGAARELTDEDFEKHGLSSGTKG